MIPTNVFIVMMINALMLWRCCRGESLLHGNNPIKSHSAVLNPLIHPSGKKFDVVPHDNCDCTCSNDSQHFPSELIQSLFTKYPNRLVMVKSPFCNLHEIVLCGTLHVTQKSVDMVEEVINTICPETIMIEMCQDRVEGILERTIDHERMSISTILVNGIKLRSLKAVAVGLLTWLQFKAATLSGSKLGAEIVSAAKHAHQRKTLLVLGDRQYSITLQRVFDKLSFKEKLKLGFFLVVELFQFSMTKMKDVLIHSDDDQHFIMEELDHFSKSLPSFAEVLLTERDEYMANSILEICRFMTVVKNNPHSNQTNASNKVMILIIVGAGHLRGIQKFFAQGGVSFDRMRIITSSSKRPSTWQPHTLLVANTNRMFEDQWDKHSTIYQLCY